MRPRERRETGEQELFRSRLDQIIDMSHPLMQLARTVDWPFLEGRFGEVYTYDPGHPPLPTRLMARLAILKHTYDLSGEVLCDRWVENPYYQYFCGEEFFQHRLVFDRSSMTCWRNRMGEDRLQALLQESLSVATKTEAIKPSELSRVIVVTTVQPKSVMFPYFHVVITLPSPVGDIACQNKAVIYDLLFKASSETMLRITADPKHLGARIGITSVLHSWARP